MIRMLVMCKAKWRVLFVFGTDMGPIEYKCIWIARMKQELRINMR